MRKEDLVFFELDRENLPPLTVEQKAKLTALSNRPGDEIDYSDIPPPTEQF